MEVLFSVPKYTDGKVVALVDVELAEGIVVRGFRIVEGTNGPFASVPARSYETDGQTRYYPLVTFSNSELKERFKSELLDSYHHWNKTRDPGNGGDEGFTVSSE